MTYKDRLSPWCIIRHRPNSQRMVVGRSRRRNDAEEHVRLLKRMVPNSDYSIIFDLMLDSAKGSADSKQPPEETATLI